MTQSVSSRRVHTLTYLGILSALTVLLQVLGEFFPLKIGDASCTFVLPVIVIGVALCGKWAGLLLGGVFSITVLAMPSTSFFYAMNVPATIAVVLVKGMAAGLVAGLVYDLVERLNRYVAVVAAAVVAPVVNTGLFLLGCRLFFYEDYVLANAGENSPVYFLFILVAGFNFLLELGLNLLLSPVIVRLLDAIRKNRAKS